MCVPYDDCERIADSFVAQPVNTLSSTAFVIAGLVVDLAARQSTRRPSPLSAVYGSALILVGIGSVAFHGPGGRWADWVHDASITSMLLLVLTVELASRLGRRPTVVSWVVVAVPAAVAEAVWASLGDTLNGILAVPAIMAVVASPAGRRPRRVGGLGLMGVGAVIMLFSRTAGPWCDPNGLLQGHRRLAYPGSHRPVAVCSGINRHCSGGSRRWA